MLMLIVDVFLVYGIVDLC